MKMEIFKKFVKNNTFIIVIFLLFIVTRLWNFGDIIWYESSQRILQVMQFITIKGQISHFIPHFPLAIILYKIGALLVGNTIFGVNLIHFILNLLTFFLVYKTALLFYNDKKVANWSILLYTISFYAYAGNTMGIDQDLALNPLLFILSLYLYKKLDLTKLKNIILLGLSCALLSSSRLILGVIIMGIIFIDILINKIHTKGKSFKFKDFLQSILHFIELFIPYILMTSVLVYLMYIIFPDAVISELITYKKVFLGENGQGGNSLLNRISFLGQVFLYVSPAILCLSPLFKNFKRHQLLLISSIIMILYMLVGTSGGDPARRMMPILPVLVILRGVVYSQYITKKNWWVAVMIAITLCFLNYLYLDYSGLPMNVNDYLSSPLNKVFILTTTIFAPIYLNSKIIFGIVGVTISLFLLAVLWKNKISKYLFISFALGVNIFFVATDMFQIKQPHMPEIMLKMSNFCYENCSITDKIYSDQVSRDISVMGLRNKYIGNYFSLDLNEKILEINSKLQDNPIILGGINLFSQNFPASDYMDTIKKYGSGFVFITHYFGNEEEINVLSKKCKIEEKFNGDVDEIYGIVFKCDY